MFVFKMLKVLSITKTSFNILETMIPSGGQKQNQLCELDICTVG